MPGLHRQTVSDVLRDGLLVLLQEEDPYRQYVSDTNTVPAIMSDGKEEKPDITPDTTEGQAAQEALTVILSYGKEDNTDMMSDAKEEQPDIASDVNTAPDIMSDGIPPFDPGKYVLGKLCPRSHDYHGTGQSLLRRSNRHCLACDREKFRERKQAKR